MLRLWHHLTACLQLSMANAQKLINILFQFRNWMIFYTWMFSSASFLWPKSKIDLRLAASGLILWPNKFQFWKTKQREEVASMSDGASGVGTVWIFFGSSPLQTERCQNTVTLRFRSNTFIPILCRGVNSAFYPLPPLPLLFLKQIALCECYWRDWCRRVISFSAKCIQIQPFASCGAGSASE